MTPTQAREIVRAAIDWVHAHDLRMAASRAKRQTGPFDRDSYRASGAVTEAKRLERMALKALHRAVMPTAITTRSREVLEVVALEVQAHPHRPTAAPARPPPLCRTSGAQVHQPQQSRSFCTSHPLKGHHDRNRKVSRCLF